MEFRKKIFITNGLKLLKNFYAPFHVCIFIVFSCHMEFRKKISIAVGLKLLKNFYAPFHVYLYKCSSFKVADTTPSST